MLRSLLVGLIAISVAPACKGGGDAPAVQPGVTAGRVLSVEGKVTATRAGQSRDLAKGADISGDDVIETTDGASVSIWISHNNATWTLESGKKGKVGESAAWTAARVDHPPPGAEEATVAAGRYAEKSAADTSSTANSAPRRETMAEPTPASAASPGPGAPAPAPGAMAPSADPAPPRAEPAVVRPKPSRGDGMSPPPPPTAQPTPAPNAQPMPQQPVESSKDVAPTRRSPTKAAKDVGDELGGDSKTVAPNATDDDTLQRSTTQTIATILPRHKVAMAACLETATLKVKITVAAHKVTIVGVGASEKANKCLASYAPRFTAVADGAEEITLAK